MNQKKFHSKKYQSDVKWLVPSLAAVTLGLSLSGTPTTVKADSTSAANVKTPAGTAAQNDSQTAAGQTSTASDQVAGSTANATSTAATASSKSSTSAAQTDLTQSANVDATQTVNVSALKAEPASSSTAIAASKAAVPVAITNYDSANASTPDASAPKSIVIGGGSDLTEYFEPNTSGTGVKTSVQNTTISTGDSNSASSGSAIFKQKINLNTDDFDLIGYVSAHTYPRLSEGFGFIFYPDEPDQVGKSWADLAINGIPGVIGWKYDNIPGQFSGDSASAINNDKASDGSDDDVDAAGKRLLSPYGAFVSTDSTGRGTTDTKTIQALKALGETPIRIEFKYDHLTHTIKVDLPDQLDSTGKPISFSEDISQYFDDSDNPVYNFAITMTAAQYNSNSAGSYRSASSTFTIDTVGGTVSYVDDDTLDTKGKPTAVATDGLSGSKVGASITYSTAGRLTELENKGYELDNAQGGDGFSSVSNPTYVAGNQNNFTVHLKHHTTQSKVTKNVTESVHYEMPAGATAPSDPASQTTSLSATETYDAVTKNFSYSGWTGKGLNQVTPPPITGYTPSISYTLNGGESHTLAETTIPATLPDGLVTSDSGDLSLKYTVTYVPTKETATIDFVDETDPTKKLKSTSFSGDYGTSVDPDAISSAIKTYTDQGYVVDPSKSDNTQNVSFNDSPTIKIYLTHGQTTITPDNPTITYPDGTTKTPTDSQGNPINTNDLTTTVNNVTVQPTDKAGDSVPSQSVPVKFDHTIVVDNVTGKTIEDKGWSADPSSLPPFAGYTPNTSSLPTYKTADDLPTDDGKIEVPYSPEVTINYVDDDASDPNNKSLGASDTPVPGDKGDPIDKVQSVNDKIAELEKKGYVLADTLGTFDGSPTITIHLKHGTTTINPDNPMITYPDGTTKTPTDSAGNPIDVTKTVTVSVQAKDKAGNPMPGSGESVQVTFHHTVVVDNVTGQPIANGDKGWTLDPASLPPFSGYITDSSTLPTLPKDGDKIEVTYDPVPPVAPSTPSNPPSTPGKGDDDSNKNGADGKNSNGSTNGGKNGNGSTNGDQGSNSSANGGKNSNGSANGGKNSNGSANGGKNSNGSANGGKNGNGSTNGGKNGNGSANGSQNGNNSAKNGSSSANSSSRLPQTGSSMMSQFIGIIMTLIAGVVGWFGFKKHDDKETK